MSVRVSRVVRGAAVAVALVVLAACSSSSGSSGPGGSSGVSSVGAASDSSAAALSLHGDGKLVVIFMLGPFAPYLQGDQDGLVNTLQKYGYTTKVITNTLSQSQEDQQVQQYLATGQKPAAFVWWPADAAAGINDTRLLSQVAPVIQFNQSIPAAGKQYVKFYVGDLDSVNGADLGSSLIAARAAQVKAGVSLHSDKGNLLVFNGSAGYAGSIARYAAFGSATTSAPFNILGQSNNADADTAYKNGLTLVPQYKSQGIDFVYAYDGRTATGAVKALQQNGLTPGKDVLVVDGNCTTPTTPYTSGQIYATTLQSGVIEGISTAELTARYLANPTVKPGTETLPNTPDYPTNLPATPSEINAIPLPVEIGATAFTNAKLWGYTADQLCAQTYTK